jgi:hypothetical protein
MKNTTEVPLWGKEVNPITGEKAPTGYFWTTNAMNGAWFLEKIGTSYGVSAASEHYWCS